MKAQNLNLTRQCLSLMALCLLWVLAGCGRVSVSEELSSSVPLSVSVSSELVIPVNVNQAKTFVIPTNLDSTVKIQSISVEPNSKVLTATTEFNGTLNIDPTKLELIYNPPVGLIGEDRILIYVNGSDKSQIAVDVLFVVSKEEAFVLKELNALVYGKTADDRTYLEKKLAGFEPPGMAEIFSKWGRFSGEYWYDSAADIITEASLSFCNSGINMTTGLFNSAVDPSNGALLTHLE